jgi:hypothetical protein
MPKHFVGRFLLSECDESTIAKPVNATQTEFNKISELGGGPKGGPARTKVCELLRRRGQALNEFADEQMAAHLTAYPNANPWHVCFSVGLCWGHLAKLDVDFTGAVVNVLADWNSGDLAAAKSFHMERGTEPIEQSLVGAHQLFARVVLPSTLPDSLERLGKAQERWLGAILGPERPRYIGSWNATAMFMAALFAQRALAKTQIDVPPILPPGGPIFTGLQLLHRVGTLTSAPAGSELDDQSFEPGALYENNALLAELRRGRGDWCLIDVHSGVYLLGTRDPRSSSWEK